MMKLMMYYVHVPEDKVNKGQVSAKIADDLEIIYDSEFNYKRWKHVKNEKEKRPSRI